MKSNVKENIGYFAIAIVVALTLVLSVVAIDTYHNNSIVAHAAAPSENTLNIYPGSTSILVPGFDYDAAEIFSHDAIDGDSFTPVNSSITLDLALLYDPNTAFQFIFYVDASTEDDYYLYLDNISLAYSVYDIATDNGHGDNYFVYYFIFDANEEDPSVEVGFHQFIDDYNYGNLEHIYLYDIRLINSAESNSTTDSFLSLIGDGITFGFDSIATGITYTMDNLFIVDGELTNFSVVIFLMTGISLALAVLKFVLNFIFSFGGKD